MPPAHAGIAVGPVIFQDGDYYGGTVNLAARLAGVAEPGQIPVDAEVVRDSPAATMRSASEASARSR